MSLRNLSRILPLETVVKTSSHLRFYAKAAPITGGLSALGGKKKLGKGGPTLEKKVVPVESDPNKLVNFVCGSCLTQTGEDEKLKSDEEYPDWLWNMRTGKPLPLNELEYDSQEYWKRVTHLGRKQNVQLRRTRKF